MRPPPFLDTCPHPSSQVHSGDPLRRIPLCERLHAYTEQPRGAGVGRLPFLGRSKCAVNDINEDGRNSAGEERRQSQYIVELRLL